MTPDPVLDTAYQLFTERGFLEVTLDLVAQQVNMPSAELAKRYHDPLSLLTATLKAKTPTEGFISIINAVQGEDAESIVRTAAHQLIGLMNTHRAYIQLATLEAQLGAGTAFGEFTARILFPILSLLDRLEKTGQLRPVPKPILARTFASALIGFVATEHMLPDVARTMLRMLPPKMFIDSMVDLLLYGLLEDDQR